MAALLASCFPEDDAERLYDEVPLDVLGKAARDNEAVLADFLRALRACEAAERQSAAAQAGLARVAKRGAAVGVAARAPPELRGRRRPAAGPAVAAAADAAAEVAREPEAAAGSVGAARLKHRLALRERYRDLDGARVAAATAVYRGTSGVRVGRVAAAAGGGARTSPRLGAVVPAPAAEADRARRRAKRFADARAEPGATRRYAAALRVLDWDFQRRQTARDEPETLASPLPPVVSRAAAALFRVGHKVDATREHVQVLQNFPHARRAILATIGRFRDAPDLGDRDAALAVDALAALFCAAMRLYLVLLAGAVARAEKKDNKSKNDECQMAVGGKLIRFKPIAHVDYGKKRSGPPTLADATCVGGYGYFGQTCCVLDAEQPYVNSKTGQKFAVTRYRCQVVIGGVQKGGSTALAAILSAHPNVQFAPHKSSTTSAAAPLPGTAKYLSQMKPMSAPSPRTRRARPSASSSPPRRRPSTSRRPSRAGTAAEMPDDAKLIVIVREPVSRLYSEFQMERRRVEPQRKFLGNLQRHAASLMLCYAKSAVEKNQSTALGRASTAGTAGLMSRDRENRYAMLLGRVSSVIARVREVAVARTPEGDGALTRFPPGSLARLLDACFAPASRGQRIVFDFAACAPRVAANAPFNGTAPDAFPAAWTELRDATAARLRRPHGRRLAKDKKTDKKMGWARRRTSRFIAACFKPSTGDDGSTTAFLTKLCYPLQSLEYLMPKAGLATEAEALEKCSADHFGKANYVAKTDEEAHAFLKKCKPKANGAIQRDFVYRSLYATQLRRCYYQGVKRAQTLVLDGAALRDDPAAVAKDVEAFAGLPAFAYAPDLVSPTHAVAEQAQRASIAKAFPSFDERIGWSIHGEYDDEGLPASVQSTLDAFFAPHNAEFFRLLGRELPDWTRPAGAALGGDRDDKRAEALAEIGLGV
ncbi:heparan sulfate sulfotransferase [Aureococcus anophagefferens]|nr:heparan sulfate sulfotransferase [Aureococcus anophagefferens]